MGDPPPKGTPRDTVTYFFLINNTAKGAVQTAAQRKKEANDVTTLVKNEGGRCHLYLTRGSPFDFVSVVTGITTAAAVRIADEIERRGAAKVTLISGIESF